MQNPSRYPKGKSRRIWDSHFTVSERCAVKIKAKIDRMVNAGNVKAIASVSLDGMFVVKNLKVMDGKKGLFVSMPQETYSGKDGQKKYSNTFFALTNSAKLELQESVLQAYQQQMDANYVPRQGYGGQHVPQEVQHQRDYYPQQYPEPQYPDWVNDSDDGMLPMDMGVM